MKTLNKQLSQLFKLYSICSSKIEPLNPLMFVVSRDNLHCDSGDDCWKATPRLWAHIPGHRNGEFTWPPYCWQSPLPGLTQAPRHKLERQVLCDGADSQAGKHSKNEGKRTHGNTSKDWELKPPLWKQGTTKTGQQRNALKSPAFLSNVLGPHKLI